ncbi:MAG: hypothetical protein JW809_00310 [Pirellulales bacterium]|nr:hypothetical protein [Pirellulales bacterium]
MQRTLPFGLAILAVVVMGGPAATWSLGQTAVDGSPHDAEAYSISSDPAYAVPAPGGEAGYTPATFVPDNGLDARVADLEAQLKKMKDAEDTAKKKAAGAPSVKLGGRIHWDVASFNQNAASYAQIGDQQNGTEFRRVRLSASGEAFHVVDYKIQLDFAGTDVANQGEPPNTVYNRTIQSTCFRDVYITVKELPLLGHVRMGQYKEPVGLEQLASSNHTSFLERSLPDEGAFVPSRRVGVMAFNTYAEERGTWAIGAFADEINANPPIFKDDDGGVACTMRGTFLPWYDEATSGRGLFHVGGSYSFRDIADDNVRFRQRPEAHLADYIVDTGSITGVPSWQLIGAESAWVYGPLSLQGEWFGAFVRRSAQPDLYFNGLYGYVSYFLTGEHRPYKRDGGIFERVVPHENFFRVRAQDGYVHTGKGAWEILYRYSYIDLNDENILGGRASDHTIGLNWYLNPYTKIMFNYVNSTLYDGGLEGNMNIFEMRTAMEF